MNILNDFHIFCMHIFKYKYTWLLVHLQAQKHELYNEFLDYCLFTLIWNFNNFWNKMVEHFNQIKWSLM